MQIRQFWPFSVFQGALLHDTVEDTHTTLDEIELNFGPRVRRIVEEARHTASSLISLSLDRLIQRLMD